MARLFPKVVRCRKQFFVTGLNERGRGVLREAFFDQGEYHYDTPYKRALRVMGLLERRGQTDTKRYRTVQAIATSFHTNNPWKGRTA